MPTYYHVKVEVSVEQDSGKIKKRMDHYLVDAVSNTDAEAKIYKEMEGYPNDWEVVSVVKTKFVDVL